MPVLEKLKEAYKLWHEYHQILPKTHRHSLGPRIDTLFIEAIEALATASFLSPQDKISYVRVGMRKIDTIKILLLILWETRSIDNKKYITISLQVDLVGKMLGGWNGQLAKQNSSARAEEK